MKKYYFINNFDTNNIDNQDGKTAIIYRNYTSQKQEVNTILKIKFTNQLEHYLHRGHASRPRYAQITSITKSCLAAIDPWMPTLTSPCWPPPRY